MSSRAHRRRGRRPGHADVRCAPRRPGRGPRVGGRSCRVLPWTTDLGESTTMGIKSRRRSSGRRRAWSARSRRGTSRIQINFAKLGPALAAGCAVVLKAAPDTPWCASVVGRIIAEQTDIPAGIVNVVTSSDHQLGAQLVHRPAGRHGQLHRLHGHRPLGHGRGRTDVEAGLPRARRQVRVPRARRRGPRRCVRVRGILRSSSTPVKAARSPPASLLPRARFDEGVELHGRHDVGDRRGRPHRSRHGLRSAHLGAAARPGGGLPRARGRRGRFLRCGGGASQDATGASSSIRRSSPVWTTRRRSRRKRFSGPSSCRFRTTATTTLSGSPTIRTTACPVRCSAATSIARTRSWPAANRDARGQRRRSGTPPTCRSAATSSPGLGREMGTQGFEEYLETKAIATPA